MLGFHHQSSRYAPFCDLVRYFLRNVYGRVVTSRASPFAIEAKHFAFGHNGRYLTAYCRAADGVLAGDFALWRSVLQAD